MNPAHYEGRRRRLLLVALVTFLTLPARRLRFTREVQPHAP
ncbi:MAG TPA: hypothetical protein VM282_14325 [Acidimicrobiales bacterium]|nr:hypothetical protein [Acidimicrobiales bacterium]